MPMIEVPDTNQGTMLINTDAIMLVRARSHEPGSVIVLIRKYEGPFGATREIGTSLTTDEIAHLTQARSIA